MPFFGVFLLHTILVFFEHAFELKGVIAINEHLSSIAAYLEPTKYIDIRDIGIKWASILIVGLMILLMTTGMPLGIVTLFVSILSALFYFGFNGLYLVSTNAFGLSLTGLTCSLEYPNFLRD